MRGERGMVGLFEGRRAQWDPLWVTLGVFESDSSETALRITWWSKSLDVTNQALEFVDVLPRVVV